MKKKSQNRDAPIGKLTVVPDFLPPPHELAQPEDSTKITLSLDRETLEFFKVQAKKTGQKYQRMMREVLKGYARRYS